MTSASTPLTWDERAHHELRRYADAEAAGGELVPDQTPGPVELVPRGAQANETFVLGQRRQRQQTLLDPLDGAGRR